jgi:hypothetical protein
MTRVVLTEFTKKVNLRHFLVPREVVPRTMRASMQQYSCDDKPVIAYSAGAGSKSQMAEGTSILTGDASLSDLGVRGVKPRRREIKGTARAER